MGYKTVLVNVADDPAAQGRIELALSVARLFDATVLGVASETWQPTVAITNELFEELEKEIQLRLEAAQRGFRKKAEAADVPAICATGQDHLLDALIRHARSADLIVTTRPAWTSPWDLVASPGALIMGTGLPILVKSDKTSAISANHVVVGWKNGRESQRALTDAMPFLTRASSVTLAQAAPEKDVEAVRADLEGAAGRLQRQGHDANIEVLSEGDSVVEAMRSLAARQGADLIVLGAYGHSRFRELTFGGVTKDFLLKCDAHVLFSH